MSEQMSEVGVTSQGCAHENVRTFRSLPPHSKCLDCGARVERRWVASDRAEPDETCPDCGSQWAAPMREGCKRPWHHADQWADDTTPPAPTTDPRADTVRGEVASEEN